MQQSKEKLSVVIVPDDWEKFHLIELKHPRTDSATLFAIDKDRKLLAEVICVDDTYNSWFIGDTIESDGRIQALSRVDPVLLAMPYLRKSAKSVPLDHLIVDSDYPKTSDLHSLLTEKRMSTIATPKGSPDLNVWQWNEDKALEYLGRKVKRLAKEMQTSGEVANADNESSRNFVASIANSETQSEEDCIRLSWQILSDWLEEEVSVKLATTLEIKVEEEKAQTKKQPLKKVGSPNSGSGSGLPTEDYSKGVKKPKSANTPTNAKQKALAKSASGSKSIMSFFGKK